MRAALAVLLAACGARTEPEVELAGTGERRVDARDPASGILELDPPAIAGAMAPNLAPGGAREALLTWVEPDGKGMRVRLSRLSGMTWSEAETIASGPRVLSNWADVPAVVQGGGGGLVASFGESRGDKATDVFFARGGPRGWSRLGRAHDDTSETEHSFSSLVADGDGVVGVWLDGRATARGEPMTLRTARVAASGLEKPALLDPRVCDCCPTAAAMTDRGPVVVYRDRDDKEVRDISIVRRVDGRWTEPAPVHRDGWRIDACPVNGPAIAARGASLAVAWYTDAGGRGAIKLAFSRDAGASFAPAVEVASAGGGRVIRGKVGVVLDAGGEAIVSWVGAGGDVRGGVWVRRISTDGRLGPERRVATRAIHKKGVPRVLLVDDWLLVAYTDDSAGPSRLRAEAVALREIAAPAAAKDHSKPAAAGSARDDDGAVLAPQRFRGRTADGRTVTVGQLRGKVAVVNLWATWCGPCVAEFPHLVELHKKYAARGVEFVALSIDEDSARDKVLAVWRKHGLPFTLWLDPAESAQTDFAAPSLPVTLVIDRRGMIRYRRDGKITADEADLNRAITSALAAK